MSKLLVEGSKTDIPTNVHGRLLSAMNMLIYDFNNNGNCNIIEEIDRDCPDENQLAVEFKDGTSPQEFVDFIADKRDLDKLNKGFYA